MKKTISIIISLLFILVITACNESKKESKIENQIISVEEAEYLIKSQYSGDELKKGYKYDYEYKSEKEKNGIKYYSFVMNIVNEKNEVTEKLPDVLVAIDGSHVTVDGKENEANQNYDTESAENEENSDDYDEDETEETQNTETGTEENTETEETENEAP